MTFPCSSPRLAPSLTLLLGLAGTLAGCVDPKSIGLETADDGSERAPEGAIEAAEEQGVVEPAVAEPREAIAAQSELAKDDAAAVEPDAVKDDAGVEGSVDGPVGSEPTELDAKSKKRRGKTKTDDTKQAEVAEPETDPEPRPEPEVPKKTKKSGDLRDPF